MSPTRKNYKLPGSSYQAHCLRGLRVTVVDGRFWGCDQSTMDVLWKKVGCTYDGSSMWSAGRRSSIFVIKDHQTWDVGKRGGRRYMLAWEPPSIHEFLNVWSEIRYFTLLCKKNVRRKTIQWSFLMQQISVQEFIEGHYLDEASIPWGLVVITNLTINISTLKCFYQI